MKRLLCVGMACALLMTGCQGNGGAAGGQETTGGQETKAQQTGTETKAVSEKVTLKIGNSQADSHPWNEAIQTLAEKAAEYSDGRMEIVNYPNATLGAEDAMLESVREGGLDMCVVDPTVGTTFCKELELFSLPFLFRDYDHWKQVLDGEIGETYKERIAQSGGGILIMDYWGGSSRNVLAVKKPVESIEDLQGFKLRLAPSELKFKVWEAVGALPVAIAFGETYSALASGLCDGMENEMPSILASKFYEPAPYFTMTGHEITVRPLFMNKEKYESLSPEMQEALRKAIDEATDVARQKELEFGQEAERQMVEQFGVTETEIDKKPIMERTKPIFKEFGENTGLTDLIEKIQAGE